MEGGRREPTPEKTVERGVEIVKDGRLDGLNAVVGLVLLGSEEKVWVCVALGRERLRYAKSWEEKIWARVERGKGGFGYAWSKVREACVMQSVGKRRLVLCVAISLVFCPP